MEKSSIAMLLSLADSYITEACPSLSPELFSELRKVIEHYITGIITCERASSLFLETIGINTPIHRISAILHVSDCPIAPFSDIPFTPAPIVPQPRKAKAWTQYEDQRLLSAITRFGLDNWSLVSQFVGNHRTRSQCAQRWSRSLDPKISRVMWTREEESRLSDLVQRHGVHAWMRIAAELGNRNDAQCRYHYLRMMKGEPVGESADLAVEPGAAKELKPQRSLLPPINLLIGVGL
jgi:hypothetical protein